MQIGGKNIENHAQFLNFVQKAAFLTVQLMILLGLLPACESRKEASSPEQMVTLLSEIDKEWVRVKQTTKGQFAIVEPYAELNTTFRFQVVPTEGYVLRIVRGLTQERWKVTRLVQEGDVFFFTLRQPGSDQTTVLSYRPLPEQSSPPIGIWEEQGESVIKLSSRFFVPASFTAGLEKRFAPPPPDSLTLETSFRQGAWSRWQGKMDGDRTLTAFFCLQDSTVEPYFLKGAYYYNRIWKDLTLRPAQSDTLRSGKWDLREYIGRERKKWTGKFIGDMDYRFRFRGQWQDPEASVALNFSLEEDILPFVLEDQLAWRKTATRRLDTLYYPRLSALENDTIMEVFNDSLMQQQLRRWKQLSQESLTPVTGDYALLFANENLISITLSIYREDHKPEVRPLNFDWQTGEVLSLESAYRTRDPAFQERLLELSRSLLRQQNPAPRQLPSTPEELEKANFLFQNLRLLYFDPVSYYYYTLYIPYEKLLSFEKKSFTATYKLRKQGEAK